MASWKNFQPDPIKIIDIEQMRLLHGNRYVAFLLQQIDLELEGVMSENGIPSSLSRDVSNNALFSSYEIMRLGHEKLAFMEVRIDDDLPFKEHIIRIFTGTTNRIPADVMNHSDPEESWMLRRITTLKKEFTKQLHKISIDNENKIPFGSVIKMYHLFVYLIALTEIEDTITDQYPDCRDDLWQIQILANIPDDERGTLVTNVWDSIHELFIECLYVFGCTAAFETMFVTSGYMKSGLENAKQRLILTAFNDEIAETIRGINSPDDLSNFFENHLSCFIDLIVSIAESFKDYQDIAAFKKIQHLNMQSVFEAPASNRDGKHDLRIDKTYQTKSKNRGFMKIKANGNVKKDSSRDDFNSLSRYEFGQRIRKSNGMLQSYELRGYPHNLVGFLQRTFSNIARDFSREHLNKITLDRFGISKRQLSRYNNKFMIGEYDHLLDSEKKKPETIYELLSDGRLKEFNAVRYQEKMFRLHKKEGCFSQNELISRLRASDPQYFTSREFTPPFKTEDLLIAMCNAGYDLPSEIIIYINKSINTIAMSIYTSDPYSNEDTIDARIISYEIDLLNSVLEIPDFFDSVADAIKNFDFSKYVINLIATTEPYRNVEFNDLKEKQRTAIISLNRMVLEEIHPKETPKGKRSNYFSKKYGIPFEKISHSTYKNYLKKLIKEGQIYIEKEGQSIFYSTDKESVDKIANLIASLCRVKK